jgi:hypothetical protein
MKKEIRKIKNRSVGIFLSLKNILESRNGNSLLSSHFYLKSNHLIFDPKQVTNQNDTNLIGSKLSQFQPRSRYSYAYSL